MSFKDQWEEIPVKKNSVQQLDEYINNLDESERRFVLEFIGKGGAAACRAFAKEGYTVGKETIKEWKAEHVVQ